MLSTINKLILQLSGNVCNMTKKQPSCNFESPLITADMVSINQSFNHSINQSINVTLNSLQVVKGRKQLCSTCYHHQFFPVPSFLNINIQEYDTKKCLRVRKMSHIIHGKAKSLIPIVVKSRSLYKNICNMYHTSLVFLFLALFFIIFFANNFKMTVFYE